ncbi:MAG: helix-turn-helix domain-containing protein [Desulfatiglandaceae bacterium]
MKTKTQHNNAPALTRGLRVLELLAQEESELSLKSIAERLSIPTPSLWRILFVLRENGYLIFDQVFSDLYTQACAKNCGLYRE